MWVRLEKNSESRRRRLGELVVAVPTSGDVGYINGVVFDDFIV